MAKELQHSDEFKQTYNPAYRAARGLSMTLSLADSILMNRRADVTILTESDWESNNAIQNGNSQMIGSCPSIRHNKASIILPDMTKGVSNDPVVTSLGYNYHAIGHRKFSPNPHKAFAGTRRLDFSRVASKFKFPFGSSFGGSVDMDLSPWSLDVYNVFECARIERLMISAFPSTRSYFASSTYNKIGSILDSVLDTTRFDKANRLLAVYMYLALRPYLARPIRMRVLSDLHQMVGYQIDDDAVMQAFNEYLNLTYDRKLDSAFNWVSDNVRRAYHNLLSAIPKDPTLAQHLRNGFMFGVMATCDSSINSEDQPSGGDEDQQSLQRIAQRTQNDSEDGEGQSGGNSGKSDQDDKEDSQEGDGGSGESQDQKEDSDGSEGQGDGDGQDSQDDGQDGQGDSDQRGGHQAGTGKGEMRNDDTPPPLKDLLEQASKEASNHAMNNESSRREVEDLRQNMNLSGTFSPKVEGSKNAPSSDYVLMQKQMAREFSKIVEDADPGFITHQPSGRVSMKRAMHGIDDYDSAFDIWDEGKLSASSMEVVLLIDNSGSMAHAMVEACQSAWAISRGVESLGDNAKVTTLFFNSVSFLSKRAIEREGGQYIFHRATGGTDPTTALVDASRILNESSRSHRLCIILTDGVWGGTSVEGQRVRYTGSESNRTTDAELVIANMQKKGAQVSIANMFDAQSYELYSSQMDLTHGADIVKHITDPKDFVAFARSIVKEAMTK